MLAMEYRGPGLTWPRPALQPRDVDLLVSVEHSRMPAVFGTPSPPSGLSGTIRRAAFAFSASQWAHWLLLILADRINMVEGVGADLARGRPPNLLAEYGLRPAAPASGGGGRSRVVLAAFFVAGVGMAVLAAGSARRRSPPDATRPPARRCGKRRPHAIRSSRAANRFPGQAGSGARTTTRKASSCGWRSTR